MSTRACYRFIPENGPNDWPGVVTVYKHMDGYPSGAADAIEAALNFAWPLPRYEADDFAAAFVAANKSLITKYQREFFEVGQKPATPETGARLRDLRTAITSYTEGDYRHYRGGNVRLVPFEGLDAHKRFASDTEYLYDIRCVGGKIQVTAYTTIERDGEWTIEKFFEGSTKQLARRKP